MSHPADYLILMMKTATYPQLPIQSENLNRSNRYNTPDQSSSIQIKRISSVEEELIDRVCRERNGARILRICQSVIDKVSQNYSGSWTELADFRNQLFEVLCDSGEFNPKQVHCLVELSLDLVYAKKNDAYRRCKVDLGFLIATATTSDVSVN